MSEKRSSLVALSLLLIVFVAGCGRLCHADDPNRLPTKCETCKYLTNEIAESLLKHNSHELIETGYNIDERLNKKNKKKYRDSELRFIEVIENVCESILSYNVHAERTGSLRYAKGESQTMGTLKGLKNRGVKVELGIPYDLWDTPSAEITQLKKYCDNMVELYEDKIEDWYKNERDNTSLTEYLCERTMLQNEDKSCLQEVFVPKPEEPEDEETKKKHEEARKRAEESRKEAEKKKAADAEDDAKEPADEATNGSNDDDDDDDEEEEAGETITKRDKQKQEAAAAAAAKAAAKAAAAAAAAAAAEAEAGAAATGTESKSEKSTDEL